MVMNDVLMGSKTFCVSYSKVLSLRSPERNLLHLTKNINICEKIYSTLSIPLSIICCCLESLWQFGSGALLKKRIPRTFQPWRPPRLPSVVQQFQILLLVWVVHLCHHQIIWSQMHPIGTAGEEHGNILKISFSGDWYHLWMLILFFFKPNRRLQLLWSLRLRLQKFHLSFES